MAKILHISKYYYPYNGGIEDVAQTIIRELSHSHIQKVICFNDTNKTEIDIVDDVEITRVGIYSVMFSQPLSFKYHSILKKLINEFQPDYIHLHLPNPFVSISLLNIDLGNIKLYIHWHADIFGKKYIYNLYKPFEKKLLLRASKTIATSEEYLAHSTPLKHFHYKTEIVQNTVCENKFIEKDGDREKIECIKQKYGGKKILFFVGRHVKYKGLEYLIEAEKLIKGDCVIVIAGRGELTKKIKAKAGDNKRIFFIGRISDEELRLYLKASYLFAFPSVNRSEAFGVALAEALYCGLPAVSFYINGSGVNWVNKDNYSGIVTEHKNITAFAKAVDKLLENETQRNEMSKNASLWVKNNFLSANILDILKKLYPDKQPELINKANVSIVLYNNDFHKVKTLVETIKKSQNIDRIFLIDNSKERNNEYDRLDVTYIFNDKNIGYGCGHNIALRQTLFDRSTKYHLIMNADISLNNNVIGNITNYMEEKKEVGALMPKVYYPNNKIQYLCRLLPAPIDLFGRRFLPKRVMKNRVARLEMRNSNYDKIIEIPHISGCFMFLRASILEKSGLFDESFFLYMEDVDLTRRIAKHAKTIFYPEISIIHEHKRGSYTDINLLIKHIVSACRYFRKWGILSDKERKTINYETLSQLKNR